MDYDHMIGIVKMMEEKLIELMGDDAYTEWSQQAMKKLFRLEDEDAALGSTEDEA